jgi:RHS repeat-associated protein
MQLNYQSSNVYFLGRLIWAEGSQVTTDRLGSVRNGGVAWPGNLGYQAQYPYGVEYTLTVNDREKYATYTRDSVTGLDYAMNRYYSSVWGRFLSPDLYGGSAATGDPQSWNRYAYVGSDPVNSTDPSGLAILAPDGPDGPDDPGSGPIWGFNGPSSSGGGWLFGGGCNGLPNPGNWYDAGLSSPWFGGAAPWCALGFLPSGGGSGDGGGGGWSTCGSKILQPQYLGIFVGMGKDLGINPMFIMAVSLQESGWSLSHVYGTNSSSNGQPLNNLFGSTAGGGNNLPYPNVQASATAWEQNWGSYLKNSPQTISDFVNDLISNPNHMYNGSPDWPISIEGGYWQTNNYGTKGAHTIGTYQSVLNAFSNCGIILPPSQGN